MLTTEKIEAERKAISEIQIPPITPKQPEKWGATVVKKESTEQIVLSVSAGKTLSIVENTYIHAHPVKSSYNYRDTDFITFRQDGGGAMNHVYKIAKTVLINMWEWQEMIQQIELSIEEKARLTDYITSRLAGFNFTLSLTYKFYLLEDYIDLPNTPKPTPKNSPSERYYRLESLIKSTGLVKTLSKE
ncbi:MAG: hypothetical protein ABS948_16705 [Solibacillus sp.]